MAILDHQNRVLTLQMVVDGAPMVGKTTLLRGLAQDLGGEVQTPGGELGGRTLFFDWFEYLGGVFEGNRLRCQVVGVPGQRQLSERRRPIVERADVVMFVADTRREAFGRSVSSFEDLVAELEGRRPPVGIVILANKRDSWTAVPSEQLQQAFGGSDAFSVFETVATRGDGVRPGFVFAVRLALDRVRASIAEESLAKGHPEFESAQALMSLFEPGPPPPDLEQVEVGPRDVLDAETSAEAEPAREPEPEPKLEPAPEPEPAREPEPELEPEPEPGLVRGPLAQLEELGAGRIWPPVEGRGVLRAAVAPPQWGHVDDEGTWTGEDAGWTWRAYAGLESDDQHATLLHWARGVARIRNGITRGRAIWTATQPDGRWVLWQLMARPRMTWSMRLAQMLSTNDVRAAAEGALGAARAAVRVSEIFAAASCSTSPLRLDALEGDGGEGYCALLPFPLPSLEDSELALERMLREEIGGMVREAIARRSIEAEALVRHMADACRSADLDRRHAEVLLDALVAPG